MRRWWAGVPFGVVALVHLAALFGAWNDLAGATKPLLMPTLLLALLVALPRRRSEIAVWAGLALVFSWIGDVILGSPGALGFLLGLVAFLLAHVAYLLLYLRPLRTRRLPWQAVVLVFWWAGLVIILVPHVGALAIPVVLYGLVLCGAAAASLATTPLVGLGALMFLVSDSILAFRMFYPGFALWQADFVIMFFYIGGQALIILGAVRYAQSRQDSLPSQNPVLP